MLLDDVDLPGLDLGEVEDVVDEGEERLGVATDRAQVAPAMGRQSRSLFPTQEIDVTDDSVQGSADLVAEVREELTLELRGRSLLPPILFGDSLGLGQIRRQPIEVLVLLTDDLHL